MSKIKFILMSMYAFCVYAQDNSQNSLNLNDIYVSRLDLLVSKALDNQLTQEEKKALRNYPEQEIYESFIKISLMNFTMSQIADFINTPGKFILPFIPSIVTPYRPIDCIPFPKENRVGKTVFAKQLHELINKTLEK